MLNHNIHLSIYKKIHQTNFKPTLLLVQRISIREDEILYQPAPHEGNMLVFHRSFEYPQPNDRYMCSNCSYIRELQNFDAFKCPWGLSQFTFKSEVYQHKKTLTCKFFTLLKSFYKIYIDTHLYFYPSHYNRFLMHFHYKHKKW